MTRKRLLIPASILFLLIGGLIGTYLFTPESRFPIPLDLPEISLNGVHRLMIFAPHCDDEVLGSGGLIQKAIDAGIDVRVVLETNGDGQIFVTMEEFRRVYPRTLDFIRMGDVRQQETLRALSELGLDSQQVIFLGYPDRGTPQLWLHHWSREKPYTSPYTRTSHSLYHLTYNPHAVYAGEDLLGDIRSLIDFYRPDLIIYPHPADAHPDHWGLSNFVRLAVYLIQHQHPSYQPELLAYLIHRPDFPYPKKYDPDADLLPPNKLWSVDTDWYRLDLTEEEMGRKEQATLAYQSQLGALYNLLLSFVRRNELFDRPEAKTLEAVYNGDREQPATWLNAMGEPIPSIKEDPRGDFITRRLVPASDWVALYAAHTLDDELWLCAELRGRANGAFTYILRLVAVDENEQVYHYSAEGRAGRAGLGLSLI
ncbi:MAG: PIG-L family deacetylase, partial [Anaerolineales bacterium]|nr:PIG-L family deacetylase [Anaerolineales bacterium]